MEFLFELLFSFLGEVLIQVGAELLLELGFHSLATVFERRPHPALAALGYFLWGLIAGGISLIWFSHSLIARSGLRIANLLVTPVIAAGAMTLLGRWRAAHGQATVRLDRFGYAFVFAFGMALIRYCFAAV